MKYNLLIFLAIFLGACAQAQPGMRLTSSNKKAIKMYNEGEQAFKFGDFENAEMLLKGAISKDENFAEAHLTLAELYASTKRVPEAIETLETVNRLYPDQYVNNYYFIANLQHNMAEYDEAAKNYRAFLQKYARKDNLWQRASVGLEGCEFAKESIANPRDFNPINLGQNVNSAGSEYFPCLTADNSQLLFTRRDLIENDRRREQEDFYISNFIEGKWSKSEPIVEINTPKNEGAPTISPDGQVVVFTACAGSDGDFGPGRNGLRSCDLFYCVRQGDQWSKTYNLGENVNSYNWDTQPSFAADGRTIYFVRGKRTAGGINGKDIVYSELDENGAWGKPKKVPGLINTSMEEESVMIHPDGQTLYFSSNGHPSLGGYDLFMSQKMPDGTWGKPVNLGYPINTEKDENSLLVSADGKLAYFASEREGGFGGLDLYKFLLPQELRPSPVSYAKGVVSDAFSAKRLEANFELIDLATGITVADANSNAKTGEFLVCLPVNKEYALNVSKEGYMFHSEHFSLKDADFSKPYALDVELHKIKAGESVVLNNVFFNSGDFLLDDRSFVELDKLVAFLQANPLLKIEIGGHTDNVGGLDTNLKLSENRARVVADYLREKGIPETRISSKGYGETKPVASNDNETGKRLNRRTEFMIR